MIELIVNWKKVRFFAEGGWFRGEDFSLIKIALFTKSEYDVLYIIEFKIAKLSFCIGLESK